MCASPLRLLRAGPPPPKVTLLPDGLFFARSLPVAAGATPVEATAQIELALEAVAPFPLAQLYYGWFWKPGAEHALVFASYRRRFTTEQASEWGAAQLVLPTFATVLGADDVQPATTVLLHSLDGVTAVHWEKPAVPSAVVFHPLPPEATEEQRAAARDALLRGFAGSNTVIDLETPPAPEPARSDREIVFRSGDFVSRLPTATATALDVRDKAELAALRNAQKRDVLMWRVTVGAAAALLLLGIGELALVGGQAWQKVRMAQFNAQKPHVEKITSIHNLTAKIEELATKRLMPLEMVTQLVGENLERKPEDILFMRVVADQSRGLYSVLVDGRTSNPAQINVYEKTLQGLPGVERAEALTTGSQSGQATFTLTAVFKPEALNAPRG